MAGDHLVPNDYVQERHTLHYLGGRVGRASWIVLGLIGFALGGMHCLLSLLGQGQGAGVVLLPRQA
jgi:hypothetical protein